MPFLVATGGYAPGLKIGGTDISDHVRSIDVQMSVDDVDVTAMGAASHQHAAGLRDDRIVVTLYQDYASGKTDTLINSLLGSSSGATIVAYTSGVTASATAPSYTMVGSPFEYHPINIGNPGDVSTTEVTFLPVAGSQITRGTA